MKFSIVFPSKGNLSGVKKLLEYFRMMTAQYGNLEVLIAVDNGDEQYAKEIKAIETPFVCKVFLRERSEFMSRDYYNWLAGQCNGDAIQAFNDDAYYITKNWDEIISESVRGKKIWLADILDNTRFNASGFQPCFPMVSRKAYETLGFLLHPQIKAYPADRKIFEVYQEADKVIKCHQVRIQHDRVEEEKERMHKISEQFLRKGYIDIGEDAMKLIEADNECLVS